VPVEYVVKKHPKERMTIIEFNIPGGVLDVKELLDAVEKAPTVAGNQGVCISGRGPVWLYAALAHKYHPTLYVATYDPRLNGCVVVATHTKEKKIGDIIPL